MIIIIVIDERHKLLVVEKEAVFLGVNFITSSSTFHRISLTLEKAHHSLKKKCLLRKTGFVGRRVDISSGNQTA